MMLLHSAVALRTVLVLTVLLPTLGMLLAAIQLHSSIYLQSLEESHHCAGWCEPAPEPLWLPQQSAGTKDSCSVAAGEILHGQVLRVAGQVEVYCLVVLVGGF